MAQDIRMDAFDARLLRALQEDGCLTNQELADAVGLSPSQCSRRRAALEAAGVIRGYRAELDTARLGYGLLVFIRVTLNAHSVEDARRFRALVGELESVQECHALAGDADFLLKVLLPGLPQLASLVNDVLLPHGSVAQVRSSIVFETVKTDHAVPVRT